MTKVPQTPSPHFSNWLAVALAAFTIFESSILIGAMHRRSLAEASLAQEKRLAVLTARLVSAQREVYRETALPYRTTFSDFLGEQGLPSSTIRQLIEDTRPVYNLARVRGGNKVTLVTSGAGNLRKIGYETDSDHMLWIKQEAGGFRATLAPVHYAIHLVGVGGTVHNSLFEAIERAGERDQLALNLADIFGWEMDFNTETQDGDKFEVLVEKKMLNGNFAGYGRILAAEYDNAGQPHQALLFREPSGQPAYYTPAGKALKKAFLRSPLMFAAPVTSRFSYHRFHPILKRYRAHLGVDYGAPVGSRVQAVADGRVDFAGWSGGSGKELRLHHAHGYETYYLHLSRILVRRGQQVHQGQVVALTGATGLATGPHLDFRIAQDGRFQNFLGLKLPPARSIAPRYWLAFTKLREGVLGKLAVLRHQMADVEQASLRPEPSSGSAGK